MCGIRSAKYQWYYLLALPVCGFVAAFIGLNWLSFFGPQTVAVVEEPARAPELASNRDATVAALEERVHELESDLAKARAEVQTLKSRQDTDWASIADLVDEIALTPPADGARSIDYDWFIRSTWRRSDRSLEDGLFSFIRWATLGEAGAKALVDAVRNPNTPLEKRKKLLEGLAFMPYPVALDLLLAPPPDVAAAANYSIRDALGMFARTMEVLPVEQAGKYIAPLRAAAQTEIAETPTSQEGWRLAAVLAFTRGDAQCRQWFQDPVQRQKSAMTMLDILDWLGGDDSRTVVESIGYMDTRPDVRKRASQVLSEW